MDTYRTGDGVGDPVVVLDAQAGVVGQMDKLAAHRSPATPHLAFSVVLFDAAGATLLQRRASAKYHFAGRWSNSCCSHPLPGEPLREAARRRVVDELGVRVDDLEVRGGFWYQAHDPASGMAEHEYDIVIVGRLEADVDPDPAEVEAVALRDPAKVLGELHADPERYTPWLPRVLSIALGEAPGPVAADVPL